MDNVKFHFSDFVSATHTSILIIHLVPVPAFYCTTKHFASATFCTRFPFLGLLRIFLQKKLVSKTNTLHCENREWLTQCTILSFLLYLMENVVNFPQASVIHLLWTTEGHRHYPQHTTTGKSSEMYAEVNTSCTFNLLLPLPFKFVNTLRKTTLYFNTPYVSSAS
jgi:hypothetical protein